MTDIVERLREAAANLSEIYPDYAEAADEITRLREENARLLNKIDDLEADLKFEAHNLREIFKVSVVPRGEEIIRLEKENARLWEERDLLNAILTNVALSMEAFDNYADIHAERSFATEGGKDGRTG